jgi:thiol-disulfide isomerase/thioredoxin
MRRLLYIVLAASLGALGCTSTGKKPPKSTATGKDRPADSVPFWEDNSRPKGVGKNDTAPRDSEGLIAGMLIDANGRPQPNAIVNITPADAAPGVKPIGVQADDQGYFMIKGLKAGSNYFLAVRGEDGGKVLGGSALTQAPNTRLLIRLTEGNVSSVTPPPVAHPGDTGPFAPDKSKTKLADPTGSVPGPDPVPKDPLTEGADQSWAPGKTPPSGRPLPPPPPPSASNPNVADTAKNWPPPVSIPGPGSRVEPPPPPASPSMSATPSNSSPLAEETPQQQRARNFTLYNLTGDPVEFRNLTDRRLIVLDFWSTSCMPCLRAIPDLIDIQARYSNYVEVGGVACDDLPWDKRRKAVEGIRDYYTHKAHRPINYNLFLEGEGREGRLQQEFRIKAYPTLVLLDHSGRELWRGASTIQLEEAIKYYLMRR